MLLPERRPPPRADASQAADVAGVEVGCDDLHQLGGHVAPLRLQCCTRLDCQLGNLCSVDGNALPVPRARMRTIELAREESHELLVSLLSLLVFELLRFVRGHAVVVGVAGVVVPRRLAVRAHTLHLSATCLADRLILHECCHTARACTFGGSMDLATTWLSSEDPLLILIHTVWCSTADPMAEQHRPRTRRRFTRTHR
eukprot:7384980-Prymnesium_polylepis.2